MNMNMNMNMNNSSIFPVSSQQLYGFGFRSDHPQSVSDHNPLQLDSKINNAYDSMSFYMMDSKPHHFQNHAGVGVHSQSPFLNFTHSPAVTNIQRLQDCPSFGSNHFTHHDNDTSPAYDTNNHQHQHQQQPNAALGNTATRKRPSENSGAKRSSEFAGGHQWTTTKNMAAAEKAAVSVQHKLQKLDHKDAQQDRVLPRKSQKLSEKITALQKLVSPYGKTDTASVLHEASIFIKVLLDQIESSYHSTRNTSSEDEYDSQQEIMADTELDLRGKGFCLVPVPLTKNLVKDDPFNHFSTAILPPQHDDMSTHHLYR